MADLTRAEFSLEVREESFGPERALLVLRGYMLTAQPVDDLRHRVILDRAMVAGDITEALLKRDGDDLKHTTIEVVKKLAEVVAGINDPLALLTLSNTSGENILHAVRREFRDDVSLVQAFKLPGMRTQGVLVPDDVLRSRL